MRSDVPGRAGDDLGERDRGVLPVSEAAGRNLMPPGVFKLERGEVEQEVVERVCGMAWDSAVEYRKRLFRERVEILRIFEEAGHAGRRR
jgi:hypothetical protein